MGDTYTGADFALSNQACDAGLFATGVDVSGNLLCDATDVYSAGFGLDQADLVFSVDSQSVVTRTFGTVAPTAVAHFATGGAGMSQVISIDVGDRSNGESYNYYRCQRTNLSVTTCLDVLSGTRVRHLTFSPNEQVAFSTPGFDIVSV